MNKTKQVFQLLFSFIALGLLLWGLYALFDKAIKFLLTIETGKAAALLTALVTIVVSVISILVSKHLERKAIVEHELRNMKIPVYQHFLETIFELFSSTRKNVPIDESQLADKMTAIVRDMIIWASPDVINIYSRMRLRPAAKKAESSMNTKDFLSELENLYRAIRKDLGHKDRTLRQFAMLDLYINDVSQINASLKSGVT